MTENQLKSQNPWLRFAYPKDKNHLYYADEYMIHSDDKSIVDSYNQNRASRYAFEPHVPPFPFLGNPFTARVILLSLNPGYIKRINKDVALLLEQTRICSKLNDEWYKRMTHDTDSMFPSRDDEDLYTAFQVLGDWYWVDMLAKLREDTGIEECDFNRRIAMIQLMPYTSEACNKVLTNLPTQQYTKKLIEYLLDKQGGPIFVVMRSESEWERLLGVSSFQNGKYKERFILRKLDKNGRHPRAQYINSNAFDGNGYERIKQILKK